MSSLDNISKKTVFTVPDRYFDQLPAEIQSRISLPVRNNGFSGLYTYGLRYALPLIIIAVILIYTTWKSPDAESILATVETKALILYFEESSLPTTDELLEGYDLNHLDVEAIEIEAYDINVEETSDELLEFELNNL